MEYQKIINLSDNEFNQTSKFRTKQIQNETNNESRGTYNLEFKSN